MDEFRRSNPIKPRDPNSVMDVQRPRPVTFTQPAQSGEEQHDTSAAPFSYEPIPTHSPQEPMHEQDHFVPPTDHGPAQHQQLLEPSHHHLPIAAIVAAIVVSLALIGVAVFAYLRSNKAANSAKTDSSAQSQQAAAKPAATAADVDSTSAELDKSVNGVDDNQDLNSADLTDQTLGL